MPRTLYSPRLSDDVVRALYREGLRRKMPMTRLADDLLRQALNQFQSADFAEVVLPEVASDPPSIPHAEAA
ncbi:MAG: hypothetical protein ABIT37_14315 [Luteolibacter sp.]